MVLRSRPAWLEKTKGKTADLADKLQHDQSLYESFMVDVRDWESSRCSGKYTSSITKAVSAYQAEEATFEEVLGYIWPLPVYRREKQKEPRENGHQVQTIDGKKCVLLDSSHGTEYTVQGIQVYKVRRKVGVVASGEMANTSEGSSEDAINKCFKTASAQLRPKALHDAANGEVKLRSTTTTATTTKDLEGDDAILLEIWGAPMSKASSKRQAPSPPTGDDDDDNDANEPSHPKKAGKRAETCDDNARWLGKRCKTTPMGKTKVLQALQKLDIDYKAFLSDTILSDIIYGAALQSWGNKLTKRCKFLYEKYTARLDSSKASGVSWSRAPGQSVCRSVCLVVWL